MAIRFYIRSQTPVDTWQKDQKFYFNFILFMSTPWVNFTTSSPFPNHGFSLRRKRKRRFTKHLKQAEQTGTLSMSSHRYTYYRCSSFDPQEVTMLTAAAAITKDFRRSSRTENRNRQDVSRRTSEPATRKLASRDRAQMPCAYTRFSFPLPLHP